MTNIDDNTTSTGKPLFHSGTCDTCPIRIDSSCTAMTCEGHVCANESDTTTNFLFKESTEQDLIKPFCKTYSKEWYNHRKRIKKLAKLSKRRNR
jgi:dihydroorotase